MKLIMCLLGKWRHTFCDKENSLISLPNEGLVRL